MLICLVSTSFYRCNGAEAVPYRHDELTEEEFRDIVSRVCSSGGGKDGDTSREILVANYSRAKLGQTGSGHFSPVGGYHPEKDLVLLFDVARFKYPPHWVPLSLLYKAMDGHDPETGKLRGEWSTATPFPYPAVCIYT